MKIHIISKEGCKYCVKAKEFMKEHNIPFIAQDTEYDISKIKRETNQKKFPYIYVRNEEHTFIGGYKELVHAYDTMKLKELGIEYELDF